MSIYIAYFLCWQVQYKLRCILYRANLKAAMEPWLAGTNGDHFTYDTTWGGLITTKAMDDGGADFGQEQSSQYFCLLLDWFDEVLNMLYLTVNRVVPHGLKENGGY